MWCVGAETSQWYVVVSRVEKYYLFAAVSVALHIRNHDLQ